MGRLKYLLTRAQYKKIKKMDHGQMSDWVEALYKNAFEDGRKSAEGLGETEMKEVLLSVKGIGEAKAAAIMEGIESAIQRKEGKALTDGEKQDILGDTRVHG